MDSPVSSPDPESCSICSQRFSFPVMPHSSVPSDWFHRHTDLAIPDPVRARHVLTRCASGSAPRPTDSQTRLPPLLPAHPAILASLQDQTDCWFMVIMSPPIVAAPPVAHCQRFFSSALARAFNNFRGDVVGPVDENEMGPSSKPRCLPRVANISSMGRLGW